MAADLEFQDSNFRFFTTSPTPPLLWFLLITLPFGAGCLLIFVPIVDAQEPDGQRLGEPYIAGFVTRSSPTGSDLSFRGDKIPSLSIDGSTGGGLKIGAYFQPLKHVFGGEVEFFGIGGSLNAPRTMAGGVTRFVDQDLYLINGMFNLLARYPGDLIQPYVGAGAGISLAIFNGDIQSAGGQHGSHTAGGLAVQALAGIRLKFTQHFFGFAEYKHFLAAFDTEECEGSGKDEKCRPFYQFNFQSHFATVGIGFTF